MNPLDLFFGNLSRNLREYIGPVSSTLQQFTKSPLDFFKPQKAPQIISPLPSRPLPPSLTPTSTPRQTTPTDFQTGFARYGDVPAASYATQFAQGASRLPSPIDRYLGAVVALMETQGGLRQTAENNLFNLLGTQGGRRQFIDYPDVPTAILGGVNQGVPAQGFYGTIATHPAYAQFRQTGNLSDFFNAYTPPGAAYGNPTIEELIMRYNTLRALFPD